MSESEITDVYNKMLEDLVRLCRILLNYQMIHGVDAEDIVQRVVLRALVLVFALPGQIGRAHV